MQCMIILGPSPYSSFSPLSFMALGGSGVGGTPTGDNPTRLIPFKLFPSQSISDLVQSTGGRGDMVTVDVWAARAAFLQAPAASVCDATTATTLPSPYRTPALPATARGNPLPWACGRRGVRCGGTTGCWRLPAPSPPCACHHLHTPPTTHRHP